MAVVINEFEVAPAAPGPAAPQAQALAPKEEKPSAAQKQHETERILRHHKERMARVRAH